MQLIKQSLRQFVRRRVCVSKSCRGEKNRENGRPTFRAFRRRRRDRNRKSPRVRVSGGASDRRRVSRRGRSPRAVSVRRRDARGRVSIENPLERRRVIIRRRVVVLTRYGFKTLAGGDVERTPGH